MIGDAQMLLQSADDDWSFRVGNRDRCDSRMEPAEVGTQLLMHHVQLDLERQRLSLQRRQTDTEDRQADSKETPRGDSIQQTGGDMLRTHQA